MVVSHWTFEHQLTCLSDCSKFGSDIQGKSKDLGRCLSYCYIDMVPTQANDLIAKIIKSMLWYKMKLCKLTINNKNSAIL